MCVGLCKAWCQHVQVCQGRFLAVDMNMRAVSRHEDEKVIVKLLCNTQFDNGFSEIIENNIFGKKFLKEIFL